jgi:hypothetical protein
MKFLIGIISGIVLAGAGAVVVSGSLSNASADTATPQLAFAQQAVAHTQIAKPVHAFTGELSHKDTGAFELKITVRQSGVLVDRDLRVLVARAKVTNRAGRSVRLPLDDATARVTGAMLPRSAWRIDDDGRLIPTFAARRVVVIGTTPLVEADKAAGLDTQSAQDSADAQDSSAD